MCQAIYKSITALRECQGCPQNSVRTTLKRYLITGFQIVVPIGIIAWLLANIDESAMRDLAARSKDWPKLGVAFVAALAAVSLTFWRWQLLVRAVQIPFRIRDAFRLGFLGYLLNFVSVGVVGGDFFKAIFIARENPLRRAEAVASVIVDRIVGLYALLLLTSGVLLIGGIPGSSREITTVCQLTFAATVMGGVGIGILLMPGFTNGWLSRQLARVPKLGPIFERILGAVRTYRSQPGVLVQIVTMSLITHSLFAFSIYLIADSLFESTPSFADHLVMVPLSMVAGALPFTPAGFGTFEVAMDQLYQWTGSGAHDAVGVLIALVFRAIQIGIAMIGVGVYWSCRREVQDVMELAQHELEDESQLANAAAADQEDDPEAGDPYEPLDRCLASDAHTN